MPGFRPLWGRHYAEDGGGGDATQGTLGMSKFNSAGLINQRMHNLWLKCQRAWEKGELILLNDILDIVYTELYSDSTKPQKELMTKLDKKVLDASIKMKNSKNGKDYSTNKTAYALRLKKKWLFMKVLEKNQGIGKSYKDMSEDDFE